MSTSRERRPPASIHTFSCSNSLNEHGHWNIGRYEKWNWVSMQPSTRGIHKVAKRNATMPSHQWKGRIVELKQDRDGKKFAKVQHIYKASQLNLAEQEQRRYPANYIFPSDFLEWEPLESITGTFQAYHEEFGNLLFGECTAAQLLARNIFFYGDTYIVPKSTKSYGRLVPTPIPTLSSTQWPIPDNTSVELASSQIENKVKDAMKSTYGSHKATISCFVPLHLFVHLFRRSNAHRTPTLWTLKGEEALNCILSPAWDLKVVQHRGDTIKCNVICEKVTVRYQIAKQQLSIAFPYRRWKLTNGIWEALDSDTNSIEQVALQISLNNEDIQDVCVNEDWSLANLREYLALKFVLSGDFAFIINGKEVRKRREQKFICKEIALPRCVALKQPPQM